MNYTLLIRTQELMFINICVYVYGANKNGDGKNCNKLQCYTNLCLNSHGELIEYSIRCNLNKKVILNSK